MTQPLGNTSAVLRRMWHAVALAEEVPDREPIQVWVAGEPWALVRLDGRLRAFADRCPHRLAPISAGRVATATDGSDRLVCGYHGWRYDNAGRCDLIPALGPRASLSKRAVLTGPAGLTEAYGLVWLAPQQPLTPPPAVTGRSRRSRKATEPDGSLPRSLTPLPAFPEWDATGVDRARTRVLRTRAGAGQLVDNFLDAAHFPFVHASSFGVADNEPLDGGEVVVHDNAVTGTFTTPYREGGEVYTHRVTKTAGVSTTAHVRLELPHATIGILLACLPERADSTRIFKLLTRDDLGGDPGRLAAFVKEEEQILDEDLSILERYPSPELPLDPRVELHTRVDRLSLAWRGVMAQAVRNLDA